MTEVVVVGAGASGLAAAAALKHRGREPLVLERDQRVGGTWARRYDRLHLHTVRRFSGLPFHPLPRTAPRYVPKDTYAAYLADYARQLGLAVRLGRPVEKVWRDGGSWIVETSDEQHRARAVVIATGRHNEPWLPRWPGLEVFEGSLVHSQQFGSGRQFAGQSVLVVGLGNSGAEIAADLVEQGADGVAVAVRSRPPITTREIAGIPVQLFGMALYSLPPRLVDRVGSRLRRLGTGDLRPYGLGSEDWGPFAAHRPPVIDVGFLAHLKQGRIDVLPAVVSLSRTGAVFANGTERRFDAIVAATGFTTGLEHILDEPAPLDERGYPREGAAAPGLFFAGYAETPRGQLFEANRRSHRLAAEIVDHLERSM